MHFKFSDRTVARKGELVKRDLLTLKKASFFGLLAPLLNCVVISVLTTTAAHAGTVLHLKFGTIETTALPSVEPSHHARGSHNLSTYIVQFTGPITKEDQLNVTSLGGKILRYLPDDALVIRTTQQSAQTLSGSSSSIGTVVPFQSEWKISPSLMNELTSEQGSAVRIQIRSFLNSGSQETLKKVNSLKLSAFELREGNQHELTGSISAYGVSAKSALTRLAQIDDIEWIDVLSTTEASERDSTRPHSPEITCVGPALCAGATDENLDDVTFKSQDELTIVASSPQPPQTGGENKNELVVSGLSGNTLSTPEPSDRAFDVRAPASTSDPVGVAAAVVASVRQYLTQDRQIPDPSAALLKAVVLHTAKKAKLDLSRATALSRALLVDDHTGIGAGETHTYRIHVSGRSRLKASLVYTDAPAAPASALTLVNQLDLSLFDSGSRKADWTELSAHNKKRLIAEVVEGDYELQVIGTNVPLGRNGTQPYALVVSLQH